MARRTACSCRWTAVLVELSTASARGEMRARLLHLVVGAWQLSPRELPTLFVPPLISAIRRGPIIYAQRKLQQLCSLSLRCIILIRLKPERLERVVGAERTSTQTVRPWLAPYWSRVPKKHGGRSGAGRTETLQKRVCMVARLTDPSFPERAPNRASVQHEITLREGISINHAGSLAGAICLIVGYEQHYYMRTHEQTATRRGVEMSATAALQAESAGLAMLPISSSLQGPGEPPGRQLYIRDGEWDHSPGNLKGGPDSGQPAIHPQTYHSCTSRRPGGTIPKYTLRFHASQQRSELRLASVRGPSSMKLLPLGEIVVIELCRDPHPPASRGAAFLLPHTCSWHACIACITSSDLVGAKTRSTVARGGRHTRKTNYHGHSFHMRIP
ncbi:hypothetical protein KC322_g66 [Hortaea werneckii]|nr:hypothetical protein KC322_g66 [Hortaea werneckii]